MKIAFICDTNSSFWIQQYIENVFGNNTKNRLSIYSYKFEDTEYFDNHSISLNFFDDIYKENNIIEKVTSIIRYNIMLRRQHRNYDVVHVHYFGPVILWRCHRIWKQSEVKYISYYGSDLLRANNLILLINKHFIKQATQIQLLTSSLKKKFSEVYGDEFDDKLIVQDFGAPNIQYIEEIRGTEDKTFCKKCFDLDTDKIAVGVGYNGGLAQQHLPVINEIIKLPRVILKKIQIVFHFGYMEYTDEYKKSLKDILDNNEIKYIFIEEFLKGKRLAELRNALDLFINAQITDALSSSVLEYLYAGAVLLNAGWLEYDELRNNGVYYEIFNSFDNLSSKLMEAIEADEKYVKDKLEENSRIIYQMYSWDVLSEKWKQLYRTKK